MIRVEELLHGIDRKLNKVASETHQQIPVEDKIIALNEAQMRLIKKKVGLNNLYKEGFDSFKVRYEDLQNLVVPYEKIPVSISSEPIKSYKFGIADLKENYYLPVAIILTCTKEGCANHPVYVKRIVKHGDVATWLNNPHYTPSFSWQETFATISSNEVIAYAPDFSIEYANISYLRYPKQISIEGYLTMDDEPTVTQHCELPDYLQDEILELAVMELGFDIDNQQAAQAAITKVLNSE